MRLEVESGDARRGRLMRWHSWFAWFPVRMGDHDVRWGELVERRGQWKWGDWKWEYRAKGEVK